MHVYAAYSTRTVADTGSHPRVSMPSHLPGPTAPIPVSAIHTVAGRRWPATAQRGALKPISISRPQPRPWDRDRELRKPFCNIAGGVAGPPCGTPSSLRVTTPFSITPAVSHLFRRRMSPPSLTRCRTNFLNHVQLTASNETATHYPPRSISFEGHDRQTPPSTRGSILGGLGLDATSWHARAHTGASRRHSATRAGRLDRPGAWRQRTAERP